MVLNIKDPETDRLARELAEKTGESIIVAVRRAIEERLSRVNARAAVDSTDELAEFIRRARARPLLDRRTDEEIIGYDQDGLPA